MRNNALTGHPDPLIRPLGRPGDLGWALMAHATEFADSYGRTTSYEAFIARVIADYATTEDPDRHGAWIAKLDGARIGCVFCTPSAARETALMRLLLVTTGAERRGIGGRLVDTCVDFPRTAGFARLELWSDSRLTAAAHLFTRAGFELIEQEPAPEFGPNVLGQRWARNLQATTAQRA